VVIHSRHVTATPRHATSKAEADHPPAEQRRRRKKERRKKERWKKEERKEREKKEKKKRKKWMEWNLELTPGVGHFHSSSQINNHGQNNQCKYSTAKFNDILVRNFELHYVIDSFIHNELELNLTFIAWCD
jgi:flagellar biosynthesis GTPase FlhF